MQQYTTNLAVKLFPGKVKVKIAGVQLHPQQKIFKSIECVRMKASHNNVMVMVVRF